MADMMKTSLQAATLGAISNCLAQILEAYQQSRPLNLVFAPILHFIGFQLLSTPPNVLWQDFLEERFPGRYVDHNGQKRLNKVNTTVKFALDQTLGALANSFLFIAGMGTLKGKDGTAVWEDCQTNLWPLMQAGWKVWPMVSLLSFTLVPVRHRILFGCSFGLLWNIYLNLVVK